MLEKERKKRGLSQLGLVVAHLVDLEHELLTWGDLGQMWADPQPYLEVGKEEAEYA